MAALWLVAKPKPGELDERFAGSAVASVLTREVFYRTFDNRRQIASYLGLASTPFQSGGMDRDRRINRALASIMSLHATTPMFSMI